jgi:DNA-directed RNA polymerase specialized sigma24 family protein
MILTSLDESLVAAAQGGSAEAFSRLVERHQQAVRAFLRRACGNWAQADDLAQETFLAAWGRARAGIMSNNSRYRLHPHGVS